MTDQRSIAEALLHEGGKLVAAGLVVGSGGNLSGRLPGGDEFIITPSGYSLAELTQDDLVRVKLDGTIPEGRLTPSSEWQMHAEAYRARPEARYVFHLHPPVSTTVHAIGREIRHLTTDHAYYVRNIHAVPYMHSGTIELAEAVAAQLDGADVVLLKHHGCLLVADAANLAYQRAMNLEAAAMATYRAVMLGDETTVTPPEYLERILSMESAGQGYGKH
ncbi:MAG TPA: class II aldolase/adducin family protein [Candidatus Limnocylindrales bacterium]|nr:class II aldolase/adducin family protein [Candidatus Limnocylindrales bacterium]